MNDPQTPPPCPSWCVTPHRDDNLVSRYHQTPDFRPDDMFGASVVVEQGWDKWDGNGEPCVYLLNYRIKAPKSFRLTSGEARALADLFAGGEKFHTGLAKALQEAADELDRITGSST